MGAHRALSCLVVVAMSIIMSTQPVSAEYHHPIEILHQLKQAHDLSEQLKANPQHELHEIYQAFKQLTPEKVYQKLINLAMSTSTSATHAYKVSEKCANQTIFTMENIRMPTQTRPSWAANGKLCRTAVRCCLDHACSTFLQDWPLFS